MPHSVNVLISCCLASVLLTSCGGPTPDDLVKQSIRQLNDAVAVFDTITDEDAAKKAEPKLEAIMNDLMRLNKQALKNKEMSPEDMAKLQKENTQATQEVLERLRESSRQLVQRVPSTAPLLRRFQQAMMR